MAAVDLFEGAAKTVQAGRDAAYGVEGAARFPSAVGGMVQNGMGQLKNAWDGTKNLLSTIPGVNKVVTPTTPLPTTLPGAAVEGISRANGGPSSALAGVTGTVTPDKAAATLEQAVQANQATGFLGKVANGAATATKVLSAIPIGYSQGANGDKTIDTNLGMGRGNIQVQVTHDPPYILAKAGIVHFYIRAYSLRLPFWSPSDPLHLSPPMMPMLAIIAPDSSYQVVGGTPLSPLPVIELELTRSFENAGDYRMEFTISDVTSGETKFVSFRFVVRRGDSDLFGNATGKQAGSGNGDEQYEEVTNPGQETPGSADPRTPVVPVPAEKEVEVKPPAPTGGGSGSPGGGGVGGGGGGAGGGGSTAAAPADTSSDSSQETSPPKSLFARAIDGVKNFVGGLFGQTPAPSRFREDLGSASGPETRRLSPRSLLRRSRRR